MKNFKKLGALLLAVMMIAAMSAPAFAKVDFAQVSDDPTGVYGAFKDYDSSSPSTTAENSKRVDSSSTIALKKELISINANGSDVFAPEFNYVYTVTPATVTSLTVTDAAAKHATNTALTVPVKAGLTTGLKVNGGTAGDASSASGKLQFTTSTVLKSTDDGTGDGVNTFEVALDFSGVTFTEPGVYRYQIVESLDNSKTYDDIDIADGGTNTLYLDVYVDGNLDTYGYVCMATNASVTTSTTKTNGFVGDGVGADKYYTYDLTISKTVLNDAYGKASHAYPFTVIFSNAASFDTNFAITETAGTGSTGISPAAGAPTWNGVAKVKDGGAITYTGIPTGVTVDVYETNDVTGVTYDVSTSVNGGTATVNSNVTWSTTPSVAVAQTTRAAYESVNAAITTSKTTNVAAEQTIAITNTLVEISPTGVVLRVAPFAGMLGAGLFLLLISKRSKKDEDEEEEADAENLETLTENN